VEAPARGTSGTTTKGGDVPVSLLDLTIIAVIAALILLTVGLYWRENRRAEVRPHDGGKDPE
jgi:hypothetical protein